MGSLWRVVVAQVVDYLTVDMSKYGKDLSYPYVSHYYGGTYYAL